MASRSDENVGLGVEHSSVTVLRTVMTDDNTLNIGTVAAVSATVGTWNFC
ncbi:MAG: hypothetical protein OEQ39_03895 [Gammaproteobacteria bacterium]|nr:hypothetical protein [Gammaproteobacteria bacterium]MDH3465869.1 hypothetical protein [Gammaproteobacteria bacterium]